MVDYMHRSLLALGEKLFRQYTFVKVNILLVITLIAMMEHVDTAREPIVDWFVSLLLIIVGLLIILAIYWLFLKVDVVVDIDPDSYDWAASLTSEEHDDYLGDIEHDLYQIDDMTPNEFNRAFFDETSLSRCW